MADPHAASILSLLLEPRSEIVEIGVEDVPVDGECERCGGRAPAPSEPSSRGAPARIMAAAAECRRDVQADRGQSGTLQRRKPEARSEEAVP